MVDASAAVDGVADAPVVLTLLHRLSVDGGVQTVVRRLCANLDPTRVRFEVATARRRIDEDRLDELSVPVHPTGAVEFTPRRSDRPRTLAAMARVARTVRADVLHLHSGMAWNGLLARLVRPRAAVVLEVHDAPGSGRHSAATDRIEGWWVRRLGAVVVCHSSSVADDVMERWRTTPERIVTFPLAVDTDRVRPGEPSDRERWRRERGYATDEVVVIVAGRLVPSKRVDSVIEAVARLRRDGLPVRLLVVGRGETEARLRAAAARLDVAAQVEFTGLIGDREYVECLRGADVMCSASAYEGFGLTIAEGMAAGLPSVATAVGGVPDVVDDGVTGVLVDPSDPAALVDALRGLVNDPAVRARMGEAARRRAVERFGVASFSRNFEDLYRAVAPTRRVMVRRGRGRWSR